MVFAMEQELINLLDPDLKCLDCKIKSDVVIIEVCSSKVHAVCPYCGNSSARTHSIYQREIQDIPWHDKQTILLLNVRKMFCDNPNCSHKTFSERFGFISPNGKKTTRLIERILMTSVKLSSVSASALLKADSIQVSKSSICDLLKKNASTCG